jgi:hypothetical protein
MSVYTKAYWNDLNMNNITGVAKVRHSKKNCEEHEATIVGFEK